MGEVSLDREGFLNIQESEIVVLARELPTWAEKLTIALVGLPVLYVSMIRRACDRFGSDSPEAGI